KQPLFADRSEFRRDLQYLSQDRGKKYPRDLRRGTRWLVSLPGESCPVDGLYFTKPGRYLCRVWARTDEQAPGSKGYRFLAVNRGEPHSFISPDPLDGHDVHTLAHRLQATEVARDPARARDGRDPDPWYDGRRHRGTIVVAPRAGSRLSDE